MANVFNHLQDWIYATDELSIYSKVILQRLVSLSKDGEQEVFCTRETLHKTFNLSLSTVSRSFKELLDKGYLEIADNPDKFSRIRFFKITKKTLSNDPCLLDNIDSIQKTSRSCLSDTGSLSNRQGGLVYQTRSSLDRSLGRSKEDYIRGDMTKNEIEDWLNQPQVNDYDDYFVGEETKEDLLSLNATTTAGAVVEKKSCAKRKETKKFSIPTTDEVASLICEWANKHITSYPQLQRLDVNLEAENFCAYWESKDWRRRGERIKSLNGTIATWLINALKYGTIAVKSANPVNDFRRTGLTREMNQQIADNMTAKASAFADLLKGNVPKKQGNVLELKGDAQ